MNKILLKILVGIIAGALAVCAAFFSIVGLSKLFAGAGIAVICMASTLEASKIVIASFLYQTWNTVNKVLRTYLIVALVIVMAITSIGIYGFLSAAYQNTKSKYDLTATQTDSLATSRLYYESSVKSLQSQLDVKNQQLIAQMSIRNSQEQRATQLVNTNKSSSSADRSARQTEQSITQLNTDIKLLNEKIISYSDSASKLKVIETQLGLKNELSSELGSLVYISKTLNIPMDKVVNILIILFIIVFDPLAICLTLAFNFLHENFKNTKENHIISNKIDVEEDVIEEQKEQEILKEEIKIEDTDAIITEKNIVEHVEDNVEVTVKEPEPPKKSATHLYAGGVKV